MKRNPFASMRATLTHDRSDIGDPDDDGGKLAGGGGTGGEAGEGFV